MNDLMNSVNTRRRFLTTTMTAAAAITLSPSVFAGTIRGNLKPNSRFKGVQIGAITYSWRSMPASAQNILNYCLEAGISSIELMGNVAEEYAGIPPSIPYPSRDASAAEQAAYKRAAEEVAEKQRIWRISAPMDKFRELRRMFNRAGVKFHIINFSPVRWSDAEIDYAFIAAKMMGADGIVNEIGDEACEKLGKFAEKHNMYAVFHNHAQPGEPGFSFEKYLKYSSRNMLNLDVGHYFGATGNHPNEILTKLNKRIFSIHLKDKTAKNATPSNVNTSWGEGDTPLADILKLIQDNRWPIYCDIELEYNIPENSDAQKEVIKCVEYCKNILL